MSWGVLGKHMMPLVIPMRKASIFTSSGRQFLVATAHSYGYEVDGNGIILDKQGKPLTKNNEDYKSIIIRAQKDAVAKSKDGGDLLGD